METSDVARALRELYATKCASATVSTVGALCQNEIRAACGLSRTDPFSVQSSLPSLDTVRCATPKLFDAISLMDRNGIVAALAEMGVLALSPPVEQQFKRLEFLTGCVIGPARLIPLVELAVFAVEQGAYERANTYAAEAYGLAPRATELHDLHTIAGIVALNAGNMTEAIKYLAESIRVCREDGFASLTCSIRALNIMLADRLLEHGQQGAVLEYLAECKDVWIYLTKQIECWIKEIQNGQKPHFLTSGVLNGMHDPAAKVLELVMRSFFLGDAAVAKSGQGMRIGREMISAEYRRLMDAAVSGKLETGKN